MRRRRIMWLSGVVLLAAVVFWPRGPRDPIYQGKPLSRWLEESIGSTKPKIVRSLYPSVEGANATVAVRALGTNALTWLLAEFARPDPTNSWRMKFNRWANQYPRVPFRFQVDLLRRDRAAEGLKMLGPAVTPALPRLAQYFGDPQRGCTAVEVMAGAGELAIPWFERALRSTQAVTQVAAVAALERLVPYSAAIPPLVGALVHTNDTVRLMAAWALDAPTARPELTIPALMEALSDSHPEVRRWAAQGLSWRAEHVVAALPALRRLMTDANPHVAEEAGKAVSKISRAQSGSADP